MPNVSQIEVSKLSLDLNNFRTVPQKNEVDAINAMISIKPDRFYAVMESLMDDGYWSTENIIVLNDGKSNVVKEGNRRIAAMKLIHGLHKSDSFGLPESIIDKINEINKVDSNWKLENHTVPCAVYSLQENNMVDKVITVIHGKGEKASRDPWNSVAKARHNRDRGANEYGLDLLEKYLNVGRNISKQQKERWSGDYPLTVLDEALRKLFARAKFPNVAELVTNYPKIKYISQLEDILLNIGLEQIKFETLRNARLDFPSNYRIPPIPLTSSDTKPTTSNNTSNNTPSSTSQTSTNTTANTNQTVSAGKANSTAGSNTSETPPSASLNTTNSSNSTSTIGSFSSSKTKATAINDPKSVKKILQKFAPKGLNRQKVVTLKDELKNLDISKNPIAFCFLLRSSFEISAKLYAADNNIVTVKNNNGRTIDKTLIEVLTAITNHLTNNNADKARVKILHGAMTELGKTDGILSVTSMNQLVHNPSFSIAPSDICILFNNIFQLLEEMN
ncbi:MAG: hypothetical protein LBL13_13110 [Bacteroidales bacterium]|jgi:hypothetical protein|nr:hypothetical protein [Bacteroidales bacterium]